jgi:hypothetical protein
MKQSSSRFLAVLLRFRCVCCVRFQLGRSRSAEVRPLALALLLSPSLSLYLSLSLSPSLSFSLYLALFIFLACSPSLPLLFGSLVRWLVCPPARFSVDERGGGGGWRSATGPADGGQGTSGKRNRITETQQVSPAESRWRASSGLAHLPTFCSWLSSPAGGFSQDDLEGCPILLSVFALRGLSAAAAAIEVRLCWVFGSCGLLFVFGLGFPLCCGTPRQQETQTYEGPQNGAGLLEHDLSVYLRSQLVLRPRLHRYDLHCGPFFHWGC